MHQNDRRFLSRMISNVDPMLIPLYESLLVDHFSLRKEWRLNAWDQLCAGASDQAYITIWNVHGLFRRFSLFVPDASYQKRIRRNPLYWRSYASFSCWISILPI